MSRRHTFRSLAACTALAATLGGPFTSRAEGESIGFPTRPGAILGTSSLRTPSIDATPLCPGIGTEHPLAQRLSMSRGDAPTNASAEPLEPVDGALLRASIEARGSHGTEAFRQSRQALRSALRGNYDRPFSPCALLELARVEIALGLLPEAAASATRAGLEDEAPTARAESASFLLAEALYLAESFERTIPLYLLLTRAEHPQLAAAARLRLADLRFDQTAGGDAFEDYETLLEHADAFGADVLYWAPRAIEAAIASGELESAQSWLERLEASSDDSPPALAIRLADVLAARGEREASRDLLALIDGRYSETHAAMLARLRIFEWNLEAISLKDALEALQTEIDRAPTPGLASYARLLLAKRLLAQKDVDAALPLLVRVASDSSVAELASAARADLEHTLLLVSRGVDDSKECAKLIERLANRQIHLLLSANDPEPFLVLGRCYEDYRLPRTALDLYRAIARRFGTRVGGKINLAVARSGFEAGDVAAARAAAEINAATGEELQPGWYRLIGQTRLADGATKEAVAPLTRLLKREQGANAQAALLLARAAAGTEEPGPRKTLYRTLIPTTKPGLQGAERPVAMLLTAGLHRRAGETRRAEQLYRAGLPGLVGAPRTEALYWTEQLAGGTPADIAGADASTPFGRLAAERDALRALRRRIGTADETRR